MKNSVDILAKVEALKREIVLNKKLARSTRIKKGQNTPTPIVDKRIYIRVAKVEMLEWVLSDGS